MDHIKETGPREKRGSVKKRVHKESGPRRNCAPRINLTLKRAMKKGVHEQTSSQSKGTYGSAKKLVRKERERVTPTQHRSAHPEELAKRSKDSAFLIPRGWTFVFLPVPDS